MTAFNETLFVGALLLALAITLGGLSARISLPVLLVFLVVGMLAGEDGPGGIDFDDVPLSFLAGNLALAVILLDGGLRTRLSSFRVGLRPALALASVGVAITAAITGAFAAWVLALDWRLGLLLGAVVASTDAAAVFAMLKASGLRLSDRIGATLEIESGVNDPMAIFLTLLLIGVVQTGGWPQAGTLAGDFLMQFGIGGLAGVAGGWAMAATARWWSIGDGLAAILLAAAGVAVFALTNLSGGSGFLAVYLFGLVAGHRWPGGHAETLRAMDGLAWLSQSALFLLLGLLATPSELPALLPAALAISAVLMLVARPIAVVACLAPFRFGRSETAFVSWVGLRGAVPIVLALFPLLAGVEQARLVFNVAFVVVLVSLLVQGTTVALAARRLGMQTPHREGPVAEHALADGAVLAEFRVAAGAPACGCAPADLALPDGCTLVRRSDGAPGGLPVAADPRPIVAGDLLAVVGTPAALERCLRLFATAPAAAGRPRIGWPMSADAPWAEVSAAYGLQPGEAAGSHASLGRTLESIAGRALAEGDRVRVGRSAFTVTEVDPDTGRPTRVLFEPTARADPTP